LRSFAQPGYLLQVDIVFGPRAAPVEAGFGAPLALVQSAAVDLLGGDVAGRLYAAGALFLTGFGPMVLLRRAVWYARCLAGLIGVLNPWVYDRMVEGQWTVVAGGAGLFLWVAAWESLQERPGTRAAIVLALAGAGTAVVSPHMLGPIGVLTILGACWHRIWRDRDRLRWALASIAMLGVLLSYAIVSFFISDADRAYQSVTQYTEADFAFFRSTSSEDYGLIVNLFGLYGYWGERLGRFPLASGGALWWPATTALLVCAAVAGAFLQRARAWLLPSGLVGLVISASTAFPATRDAVVWAAHHVPLLRAYREPEKWSALWLLAIVTLAAGAVDDLARAPSQRLGRRRVIAPTLAYTLAVATLFPSGLTQIRAIVPIVKPLTYPSYWYRTRDYLADTVPETEPVVVLPWHLYQPLAMSEGRLVANPARVFFPGRIVLPRNLEIPGRATDIVTPYDRISLVTARQGHATCSVAREIRRLGVHWVLVLDAPEGREAARTIHRCGFTLVQGHPGRTALFRS